MDFEDDYGHNFLNPKEMLRMANDEHSGGTIEKQDLQDLFYLELRIS